MCKSWYNFDFYNNKTILHSMKQRDRNGRGKVI